MKTDDDQIVQFVRMSELGQQFNGGDLAQHLVINAVGLFGHQKPEDWKQFMPWVVHVHAKFYDIDADGNEPSIPHDIILRDLVEAGYGRYISTEWEGWHWNKKNDPFDMVARRQALSRRTLESLAGA